MKRFLLIGFIPLVLLSCSQGRKTTHAKLMENAPDWVMQTPNHQAYYHGVGMSAKTAHADFRERARQVALNELAGNISVMISSSSVLNLFDFDNNSSEFFRDNIRMSTQEFLEGYELVENWENDQQYWVYYRLSKSRYQQIKQERIDNALSLSASKFEQARVFAQQGKMADALGFYVRAFEDIRNFIGEDLKTSIDGQEKPYATALMADLTEKIQTLSIVFPYDNYAIKPGSLQADAPIEPVVRNATSEPVSGIPVISRFSWLPGHIEESITNSRGEFRIVPTGLKPGSGNEQLTSRINLEKIARQNSSDLLVQKFFEAIRLNNFSMSIEVIPPVIFISSTSSGPGVQLAKSFDAGFGEALVRIFRQEGFEVTREQENADYALIIQSSIPGPVRHGSRFTTSIQTVVELKDNTGKSLLNERVEDISGLGSTAVQSIEDAYNSLQGKFRISLYPGIMQALFK